MAAKDANKTRRGTQTVTDLSQRRLDQAAAGEQPRCDSPLVGQAGQDNPKRCRNLAGAGTDHIGYGACSRHAGLMPSAKKTAAREMAAQLTQKQRFYGDKAEVTFEEALMEEMQRSVGVVRWIESKLAEWGSETLEQQGVRAWSADETGTGLPALIATVEGFRSVVIADTEYQAWLRQYLLERQHLARVAKAGIDAGVAQSVIQIWQKQADQMHLILVRALEKLGIPHADPRVIEVLPIAIREVVNS